MTQRRSLLTTVLLCLMVSAIVAKELISSKLLKQHLVKKGFIKESYKPAPQHEHLFQGNHLRTSASSSVGWAMASSWFNKEECTDAPNIVMGALTNVCFIDLSNVTAGARSFQYSCSPQGVVMQEYTGQDYCSPTSIVNATTIPYGCNYEPTVDGDILGDLMGIALNISCTDSLTLDLGNEYILTEGFDTEYCQYPFDFSGPINGTIGCFTMNSTLGIVSSIYYDYPYEMVYYDRLDCTGNPTFKIEMYDQEDATCHYNNDNEGNDDDYEDDDNANDHENENDSEDHHNVNDNHDDGKDDKENDGEEDQDEEGHGEDSRGEKDKKEKEHDVEADSVGEGGQEEADDDYEDHSGLAYSQTFVTQYVIGNTPPSRAPTMSPTVSPTRSPTLSNTAMPSQPQSLAQSLQYDVTQVLQGIDAATYNADFSVNNDVLSITVSTYMQGVDSENVEVWDVVDAPASAASKGLQAASTQVTYSVYIPNTATVGYTSASEAYNTTTASLNSSLANNDFTSTLQLTAFSLQATSLESATSNNAAPSTAVVGPPDNGDSSNNDSLSDAALAGIVVGAVIGAAILAAVIWGFVSMSSRRVDDGLLKKPQEAIPIGDINSLHVELP